jgi:hypothetical protein
MPWWVAYYRYSQMLAFVNTDERELRLAGHARIRACSTDRRMADRG